MPRRLPQTLLTFLTLALASAESAMKTIDDLSFGLRQPMATPGKGLAGFKVDGEHHTVRLMKDRIMLTPPVPGHAKGGVWTEKTAPTAEWMVELDFRTTGEEMGSGNLQFWYAKSHNEIGLQSVYNVEKFDGLVLVVDQYGGSGGKIRGFLNDGQVNFRTHAQLESLAFGHCDYSYRNRGAPSKLKISHQGGLHVTIDGKTCFSSDRISLPAGYYFGLTATTGDRPDQFEVFKFNVQAPDQQSSSGQTGQQKQQQKQQQQQPKKSQEPPPQSKRMDAFPGSPEAVPDRSPDQIKGQEDQFADLHNRLQSLSHHMGNMFWEVREIAKSVDQKHQEILRKVESIGGSKETGLSPVTVDKISSMHDRSINMETDLKALREDLEGKDFAKAMDELHTAFSFIHHNFHNELEPKFEKAIKQHSASLNHFLIAVFIVQAIFALMYIFYKKRKHSAPKKFFTEPQNWPADFVDGMRMNGQPVTQQDMNGGYGHVQYR